MDYISPHNDVTSLGQSAAKKDLNCTCTIELLDFLPSHEENNPCIPPIPQSKRDPCRNPKLSPVPGTEPSQSTEINVCFMPLSF